MLGREVLDVVSQVQVRVVGHSGAPNFACPKHPMREAARRIVRTRQAMRSRRARDTRGILNPAAGRFRLARPRPAPDLAGFVEQFWLVELGPARPGAVPAGDPAPPERASGDRAAGRLGGARRLDRALEPPARGRGVGRGREVPARGLRALHPGRDGRPDRHRARAGRRARPRGRATLEREVIAASGESSACARSRSSCAPGCPVPTQHATPRCGSPARCWTRPPTPASRTSRPSMGCRRGACSACFGAISA